MYADGRLITLRTSGFLEQRLTPEGVELLRSEIVSTGLFEHHQPAGRMSSPHALMQVRNGDRLVHVEHVSNPERLAERLADPASWLPASAWKDRQIRAYVASRYAISYFAQPQTLERSRILSLLPAAAEDLLRAKDAVTEHEQWAIRASRFFRSPVLVRSDDRGGSRARPSSRRCRAQTAKGGERAGVTGSRSQARASIDPLPRKGKSETWSSSTSAHPPGRRARLLGSAGERLRIDRLQAHDVCPGGIRFRNQSRGFDNEHREEYV